MMKRVLYLGLDPSRYPIEGQLIHYPMIKIVPRPLESLIDAFQAMSLYTHCIFTSKNAVNIFFNVLDHLAISKESLERMEILAVGKVTAHVLYVRGMPADFIAREECQEGI